MVVDAKHAVNLNAFDVGVSLRVFGRRFFVFSGRPHHQITEDQSCDHKTEEKRSVGSNGAHPCAPIFT